MKQHPPYLLPPRSLPPLDLQPTAQEWNSFICTANTMEAWQVSSMVLHAVARETNARALYSDAWTDYEQDHDGPLLCSDLCHVLEELVETLEAWKYVLEHLQIWFPVSKVVSLQQRVASSQQDFLRISQLNLLIQHEIQQVAQIHHVLLRISVLEQKHRKDEETHE